MIKKCKINFENAAYTVEQKDGIIVVNGQEFRFAEEGETIRVNNNPHSVEIRGPYAVINGVSYPIEVMGLEEPKPKRLKAASVSAGEEAGRLTAIMPGLIGKIFKKEGEKVIPGDVIMILEAMKMQNELTAKIEGRVKQILVKEGMSVEMRQVLAVIE